MTDGLAKLTGAHGANPLGSLSADIGNAGLVTAAWQMFALLMYIYAGDFLLIAPINFWHRGRRAADYGLTRAGRSWTSLIGIGLAACALSMWPVMTVDLINSIHPSQTVAWRQAFFSMSWMRWQFWLFAGAASYAVIPVVEELFTAATASGDWPRIGATGQPSWAARACSRCRITNIRSRIFITRE